MTTEIMKSFSSLQDELEKAKDNLKAMDEHIKKLTGRDPGDMQTRLGVKRPANAPEEFRGRGRGFPLMRGRPGARPEEDEPPAAKKRPGDTRTVFSRLSGPSVPKRSGDSDVEDELPNKPAISSRVIATPKEPPSRQEAMAAQSSDQRSHERNRRMFGALLGTLQKFRQEETRMKEKEEKRAKVERKLEENAKREKEELKRERQELFLERKRKQAEIRKIELKMLRIKEQDEWEAKHRHLLNFIQTRAKPHIFYLPKIHTVKTEERLVASQKVVAKMIEKKRAEVRQELEAIERRGRWRQGLGDVEPGQHSDDDHPLDLGDKENRLELLEGPHDTEDITLSQNENAPTVGADEPVAEGGQKVVADVPASAPPTALAVGDADSAAAKTMDSSTKSGEDGAAAATGSDAAEKTVPAVEGPAMPPAPVAAEGATHRRRRRRDAHDEDDDENEDSEEEEEEEEQTSRARATPSPAALPQRPRRRTRARRSSARSEDDEEEDDASNPSPAASPLPAQEEDSAPGVEAPSAPPAPEDSSSPPAPPHKDEPEPMDTAPASSPETNVEDHTVKVEVESPAKSVKESEAVVGAEAEPAAVEMETGREEDEDEDEDEDAAGEQPPVPGEESPSED